MTDSSQLANNQRFDMRPVPDPTVLTTEALQREIGALKELLYARITSVDDINRVRFADIGRKFDRWEEWRKEQKQDTANLVESSFQAAKEATAKSEAAFTEQARQQYATFTESIKGVSTSVNDLKDRVAKIEVLVVSIKSLEDSVSQLRDRVNTIEASKIGATETRVERRSDTSNTLGLIAGITGFLLFLMAVAGFVIASTN